MPLILEQFLVWRMQWQLWPSWRTQQLWADGPLNEPPCRHAPGAAGGAHNLWKGSHCHLHGGAPSRMTNRNSRRSSWYFVLAFVLFDSCPSRVMPGFICYSGQSSLDSHERERMLEDYISFFFLKAWESFQDLSDFSSKVALSIDFSFSDCGMVPELH